MYQDGGVRSKPPEPKKPQAIPLVRPLTAKLRQAAATGLAKEVIQNTPGRIVAIKSPTVDRRNPKFPDGFQPGAIRLMFSSSLEKADAPADTFPDITVNTQLNALSKIPNRDLIETGFEASEQCRALGISKSNCFLCGFSLQDPRLPFASTSDIGYPQCEHLLPAAAALLVFGLVDSAAEARAHGPVYTVNYAYAHSMCNREKGSRLFISMRPEEYSPTASPILEANIRKYLDDLYTFNTVFQSLVPNKVAWVTQQVTNIKTAYQPLSLSLGGLGRIGLLVGVTTYFKNIDYLYAKVTNVVKNKKQYAEREARLTAPSGRGRKTFRRKNNGKSVRRATTKGHHAATRTYRNRRTSN